MKLLIVLVVLSITAVGCGGASSLDAADEAELLGAAAAHRVLEDNSLGGQDVLELIEVVEVLGRENRSDVRIEFDDESPHLTSAQRAAIVDSLSPKEVEFVPVEKGLTGESATRVAQLSFASPEGTNNDAIVATALVCGGGECGAGGAQRFVATDDGGWRFVENIGGQWIS